MGTKILWEVGSDGTIKRPGSALVHVFVKIHVDAGVSLLGRNWNETY